MHKGTKKVRNHSRHPRGIIIKSAEQVANIRIAGRYLTELLALLSTFIKPGMSLLEIEQKAEAWIKNHKVIRSAFKGYKGYPANLCLSVNDCLVHGIPDEYILKTGDVLKVDCGIVYNGGIADAAFTIVVGGSFANIQGQKLIDATKCALDTAVQVIKPGVSLWNFGYMVEKIITEQGFSVITNLTGHGVGTKIHEKPYIYNYPCEENKNVVFQEGMVVALEPITAVTSHRYRETKPGIQSNNRNLYTLHGDIGAQWEYTVLVTKEGYEILAGLQKVGS